MVMKMTFLTTFCLLVWLHNHTTYATPFISTIIINFYDHQYLYRLRESFDPSSSI